MADLDASKVGIVAAELMDLLAEESEGEERVGEVLLLAEIRGCDDDGAYTHISWKCTDSREWVQRGLLRAGLDQERRLHLSDGEEEDE